MGKQKLVLIVEAGDTLDDFAGRHHVTDCIITRNTILWRRGLVNCGAKRPDPHSGYGHIQLPSGRFLIQLFKGTMDNAIANL